MVDLHVKNIWSFTSKPTEKSPSIVGLDVFRKESFFCEPKLLKIRFDQWLMETGASKFNGEIRINRWIWGMEDSLQNFGPLSSE